MTSRPGASARSSNARAPSSACLPRASSRCPVPLIVHEHPADAVGDAYGLLGALGLDGEARYRLVPAAAEIGELDELQIAAHARAGQHGGGEADLVPAIVDAQPEAAPFGEVFAQAVDQRERQVAVCDRRAEGALGLGALDVDVDPLVVA